MTKRMHIQMKNVGTADLPAIAVGNWFGIYEKDGNSYVPAMTRHGSLQRAMLGGPRTPSAYHTNGHKAFAKELASEKDYTYVHQNTLIFNPKEGVAGVFYKFEHATKSFCIFRFYKVN